MRLPYYRIENLGGKGAVFLLCGGAHTRVQKQHWEETTQKCKNSFQSFKTIQEIRQRAVRAYPNWTLADDELWANIQRVSDSGNLSLLPEQTEFLGNLPLPLYINGQAGSGKSTMLYYIFANTYYYKYKKQQIQGDIIFITENEDLLKNSRDAIRQLLLFNPDFQMNNEDLGQLNSHFISFKELLLSLLPESDKTQFDTAKYLDFSEFKRQYEKSPIKTSIKNEYSAELVWFAISTFIYGYDIITKITTSNYDSEATRGIKDLLPKEILQGIEKEPLKFYESLLLEEGYWDKIKIIKHLENSNQPSPGCGYRLM